MTRKKRNPDLKTRKLRQSWSDILEKYDVKSESKAQFKKSTYSLKIPRETVKHQSLESNSGSCAKPEQNVYTGENMIGIATLHKSNGVPIFRQEDAEDVSKMRR